MARIQIPLDVLTSRLNLGDRFSNMRSTSLSTRFANLRPVSEFFDIKRVSKPANFAEMQSRINYNIGQFSSNYSVVVAILFVYGLITSPWLLFDIAFVGIGMFLIGKLRGQDLEIGQSRFTTTQLYTGLYIFAIPIAGGGLGGRPRAPKRAPHGGRPSRRDQRDGTGRAEYLHGFSINGHRVEEIESDIDVDSAGVNLIPYGSSRYTGDSLAFTGIDLGGGAPRPRKGYQDDHSNDDDLTEEDTRQDTETDSDREGEITSKAKEDALVESALRRIRRAQEKGKPEVKLNKAELAAWERRRQQLQAEAARERGGGSSGSERRRRRESRVAVPLAQLEPPSRKDRRSSKTPDEIAAASHPRPPIGYFPPPSATRSRPRSSTNSSSRPSSRVKSRDHSASPLQPPPHSAVSAIRQSSDPSAHVRSKRSSIGSSLQPSVSAPSSRSAMDPFQYMTNGSRAPSTLSGAGSSRRIASGPPLSHANYPELSRRADPAADRGRRGSRRYSLEESEGPSGAEDQDLEATSDEEDDGARIANYAVASDPRTGIVVEIDREPTSSPDLSKAKRSSTSTPTKRKSGTSHKKKGR